MKLRVRLIKSEKERKRTQIEICLILVSFQFESLGDPLEKMTAGEATRKLIENYKSSPYFSDVCARIEHINLGVGFYFVPFKFHLKDDLFRRIEGEVKPTEFSEGYSPRFRRQPS